MLPRSLPRLLTSLLALVVVVAPLCPVERVAAQAVITMPQPRPTAYLELAGTGGIYSLNFEPPHESSRVLRYGATSWDLTNLDNVRHSTTALLAGASWLIDVSERLQQPAGRFVELGGALVGGTFEHYDHNVHTDGGPFLSIVPGAGLRYQPPGRGWMYRLTFTPLLPLLGGVGVSSQGRAAPSAGGSVGYTF